MLNSDCSRAIAASQLPYSEWFKAQFRNHGFLSLRVCVNIPFEFGTEYFKQTVECLDVFGLTTFFEVRVKALTLLKLEELWKETPSLVS
jgi:hypothetical protein